MAKKRRNFTSRMDANGSRVHVGRNDRSYDGSRPDMTIRFGDIQYLNRAQRRILLRESERR